MEVIPHEDFSHTVIINGVEILFRELTGKDIYFIELWREEGDNNSFLSNPSFLNQMVERLSVEPWSITEDELTNLVYYNYNDLIEWFCDNRLRGRIMTLNDWLTLCFHLSKQRWTSDMDWFERQPIIKIIQMSDIQTDFHTKVNENLEKSKRKK